VDGANLTFPLRAGLAVTRFGLRAAGDVAGYTLKLGGKVALAATEAAVHAVGSLGDGVGRRREASTMDVPVPTAAEPATTPFDPTETIASDLEARVVDPEIPPLEAEIPPLEAEIPPLETEIPPLEEELPLADTEIAPAEAEIVEPEPTHISEEPELVEEIAEPGAEEGAGASVEIAEPWPGYRLLSAADVIARIDGATPAELAGIELYESAHRNRQTVLEAAQRSLKTKTGRGSPDRRE
jgi:hypothetical protein